MIRIVTESMSDFTQEEAKAADLIVTVSYTHLTLPTILRV